MIGDAERMARAGDYVLGRMSARERERAERDLETDDAFRLAVMEVAERMRHAHPPGSGAEAAWAGIAQRLAALPHMRGVDLPPGTAPMREAAVEQAQAPRLRPALRRWGARLRHALSGLGRGTGVEAVAVLQTATRETAAVVELRRGDRLRLLLLQDFPLRAGEQLALWGQRGDGGYRRLDGFAPRPEIRLRGAGGPWTGFALARERISPALPTRMLPPPLAEGLLRPLAGQDGLAAAAWDGRPAETRPAGRRGNPG